MNKRLKLPFLSLGLALSAALSLGFSGNASAVVDNTPDCDNVAIIRCGVFNKKAMREKAAQGDVPRVFNAFGIKQKDLDGKFVDGIVWRDGRVTVEGKTVATGAMTAGRNFGGTPIPNTNNAGKYPTSKFVTEGQTAFVKMVDGKFSFAIIKACGNPVSATPKPKPEPPKPKPEFECVRLSIKSISRTKHVFTAKATASKGAVVEKYEFNFGDGWGVTTTEPSYTYEYKTPGNYNATVTAHIKVNDKVKKVTGPNCAKVLGVSDEKIQVCDLTSKQPITIDKTAFDATKHSMNFDDCKEKPQPPVTMIKVCELSSGNTIEIKKEDFNSTLHSHDVAECDKQEEVPPTTTIPSTGAGAVAAGIVGSGSLGYGAYSYLSTRRKLISKLLSIK